VFKGFNNDFDGKDRKYFPNHKRLLTSFRNLDRRTYKPFAMPGFRSDARASLFFVPIILLTLAKW
jgi:hypothetical protein